MKTNEVLNASRTNVSANRVNPFSIYTLSHFCLTYMLHVHCTVGVNIDRNVTILHVQYMYK